MGKSILNFRLLLLLGAVMIHGAICAAYAASFKVTGHVTDEEGEPLTGVSIQIEKINGGVTTDIDGNYTITLNAPSTLVFSYVGMTPQKIKVSATRTLNVEMKTDVNTLEDVVVVGYGVQRKINLTGAVQSVSSDEIIRRSTSNGSSALQGIIPGLTATVSSGAPGGDQASLQIRGLGSLNSSSSPLILIDGVEGDMNRIDLNNVESISVLKDAASASVYGSRASNGVILVTTKRGSQGKPKVTFNGYIGWNKPTEMPEPLGAVDLMRAIDVARANNDQEPIYTQTIEDYLTLGVDNYYRYDTNWRDLVIKSSAMVQNYSVGVSGGSDFLSVYASAGYYKQEGMIPNNEYRRMNLRLNTDMKINRFIKLGVDMGVRQSDVINPIGGSTEIIQYAMTYRPFYSGINNDGTWGYGVNGVNPIALVNDGGYSKSQAPQYNLKATATITPIDGLTLLGVYSWQRNNGITNTFQDNYELFENGVSMGIWPTTVRAARESRSQTDFIQFNLQATYEKTFAKAHYLKLMGAFQSEDNKSNNLEAARKNYLYDGYEDIAHGDASTATNSSYRTEWALMSYLFRVNYVLMDRYLLEVNGRYDGTSRFMKGRRWGFFPSISAGWRISEENFFKPLRGTINNLKIRASYGRLGNQAVSSAFPYLAAVSTGESYAYYFDNTFNSGAAQIQLANPLITWEKSNQYDVGVDVSLFNNRLSGTFDYYVRHIDDMLQTFQVPVFVGMSSPMQNAGSMRNNGWELSINWNDRIGNLSYYAKANLSDVRNKIIDLYGNEYKSGNRLTVEGEPYGNYYGYVADGYYTSQEEIDALPAYGSKATIKPGFIKYKDLNGDGVIDGNDRTIIGNPTPHYNFGLTLGGMWKGLDFEVFLQGVGKRDVIYTGYGSRALLGVGTMYKYQLDTWTPENQDAKFPLLLEDASSNSPNNLFSSHWVQSGAYCRLKNVVVGYTIPAKWTNKAMISKLRVYATAQNLLTVRGKNFYKGFDPEQSTGASCYPLNKTFLFGVNVEF